MNLLIIDDHVILRKGIIQILKLEFPDTVFFEASSGTEAISILRKEEIHLGLLDVSMPGMDGIEVLKQLKSFQVNTPIIVLSMQSEEQYAIRAIKAGAYGYLKKNCSPESLIEAVKRVLSGKKYISQSVANILAEGFSVSTEDAPHQSLSDREMQVLHLFGKGKSVSEIAKDINLTVNTVSTYRARISEKLGLKNNAAIIKYAIDNNLD